MKRVLGYVLIWAGLILAVVALFTLGEASRNDHLWAWIAAEVLFGVMVVGGYLLVRG